MSRGGTRAIAPLLIWALIIGVFGVATVAAGPDRVRDLLRIDTGPPHPKHWDPRVQATADFVEKVRGLQFKHPVYVDFMTPKQYSAATRSDTSSVSEATKTYYDTRAAEFRAMGLATGPINLLSASNDTNDSGTLAQYLPAQERIIVRGSKLTPGLRVTLAHELTHALQDQRFDLDQLTKAKTTMAALAYRALLEGDATHVENTYITDKLTKPERKAYRAGQLASQKEALGGLANVPPAFIASFDAPYALGIPFVNLLFARDGTHAIDFALQNPPTTDAELMEPAEYANRVGPAHSGLQPIVLTVPKGDKPLDGGAFGSINWYLMLATRISPAKALAATDGWANDGWAVYQHDGHLCFDAEFRGDHPTDLTEMRAALDDWVDELPLNSTKVTATAKAVTAHACDPGPGTRIPVSGRVAQVLALPASRLGFTAQLLSKKKNFRSAVCIASRVLGTVPFSKFTTDRDYFKSSEFESLITARAAACG